jgi:RNA polymerase sigma-70 factor (ECF subfamily)
VGVSTLFERRITTVHRGPAPATTGLSEGYVDDARLAADARSDPDAFAMLYERHFAGIYGYCYRALGTPERAEDAAQQVFAGALASLRRYREAGRFREWLYTIAHHVIRSELAAQPPTTPLDGVPELADRDASPEDQALRTVERRLLQEAIARLPDDQRTAIELRIAGLKGREIAQEMGRSHDAVKMLQHRAIDRLSAALGSVTSPPGGRRGA